MGWLLLAGAAGLLVVGAEPEELLTAVIALPQALAPRGRRGRPAGAALCTTYAVNVVLVLG